MLTVIARRYAQRGDIIKSSIFFNKTFRFAALASAVALGAFGASNSFAADSAAAASTADVIDPIAISNDNDLAFGRFAATDAVGTVIVTTAGARTGTGGVILSEADSTQSAATFTVTGDQNASYDIGLTNTALTDTSGGAGADMTLATITDFTGSDGDTTETNVTGTSALTGGTETIYLGGILSVAVDQAAGDYAGTVTATVEYN